MAYFRKGTTIVDELGNPADQNTALQTVGFNLDKIPEFSPATPTVPTPASPAPVTPATATQNQPQTQSPTQPQNTPSQQNPSSPQTTQTETNQPTPVSYGGSSVVDFLTSIGKPSDFASRSILAKQQGIQDYKGTENQNTQLLSALRTQNPSLGGSSPANSAVIGATKPPTEPATNAMGEQGIPTPKEDAFTRTKNLLTDYFKDRSPQSTFSEVYKQIYKDFGLDSLKQDMETQAKEQADLQTKKLEEAENINQNPWLSEGLKSARLESLDKKYETKELIFQNKIKLLESRIDNARQDAQFIAGQTMSQINKQTDLNQDIIMKAIDIAEKESEAERKLSGPTSVQEYEYAKKQGYKGTYLQYQDEDANRKAKALGGGGGGYTDQQLKSITKINQDVSKNSTYTKTTSMRNYGDNVIASLSLGTGVGDISAINQFQKVIDEGAVTRDQDVKLIQGSQSLADTLKTKIRKLQRGEQLSPELRRQMRVAVEAMYEKQVEALQKDPYISAKTREATLYGLTPSDTILGELGGFTTNKAKVVNTATQTPVKTPRGNTFRIIKLK